MQFGKRGPVGATTGLALCACLACGCTAGRPIDRDLMADKGGRTRNAGVIARYTMRCPDVVEVQVAGQPELSGRQTIGADGRIELGALGRLRIEGSTLDEAAGLVALASEAVPEHVRLDVAEYNSQQIYLIGQVVGWQRAVPYQGPETVLDLLQRVGGVTPGAAANQVYVIRSRITEGRQPEVFAVDLQAILAQDNDHTNIRLQPFDQVHVGESQRSTLEKCCPHFLRPLYQSIFGLRRQRSDQKQVVQQSHHKVRTRSLSPSGKPD